MLYAFLRAYVGVLSELPADPATNPHSPSSVPPILHSLQASGLSSPDPALASSPANRSPGAFGVGGSPAPPRERSEAADPPLRSAAIGEAAVVAASPPATPGAREKPSLAGADLKSGAAPAEPGVGA